MKVALVVNRVLPDTDTNLTEILKLANEASDTGADLILFPEAALTGLINNDIPSHDLPLGQVIPGPVTEVLSQLTRKRGFWLAIGLLEHNGSCDQERWDREEKDEYIKQVKTVGVTTLMTNYIADKEMLGGAFGGAMIVSSNGTVIDSFPLGKVGMLLVNL